MKKKSNGTVAPTVERLPEEQGVAGSSPASSTNNLQENSNELGTTERSVLCPPGQDQGPRTNPGTSTTVLEQSEDRSSSECRDGDATGQRDESPSTS